MKIWSLEEPHLREAISKSYSEPRKPGNQAFQTYTEQIPLFSSTDVHTGYIGEMNSFVKKIFFYFSLLFRYFFLFNFSSISEQYYVWTDLSYYSLVDSTSWIGNCVLSKSTNNRITLWAPDSNRYKVRRIDDIIP